MNYHSIEDLRERARRRLPRMVFEYVDGGAENETTLRRNRQVFDAVGFRRRALVDVSDRSQAINLFGRSCPSPFLIGPTGFAGLAWPQADLALARAAAAHGVPFVLCTPSTVAIERVASAGGRLWFQLYVSRRRELSSGLIARALAAGFEALVVTVDVPVGGKRERDLRNGFTMPPRFTPATVLDVLRRPHWLAQLLANGMPRLENMVQEGAATDMGSLMALMNQHIDPGFTWEDLRWLRSVWPRTLVVKGLMRADDARRAVDCGADAIVVSNHGGRQLDGEISSLEALPEVVDAVGDKTTVLIDSGFRRGTDIVKALALGARGVLLGRATLYGVAAAGEAGAARALQILAEEVDRVLALLGCPSVEALDRDLLVWPALGACRTSFRPCVASRPPELPAGSYTSVPGAVSPWPPATPPFELPA